MISQGRGLGVLDVFEPGKVLSGQLTERHASTPALFDILLQQRLLRVVLANELEHPLAGLGFGQRAFGGATAPPTPAARSISLYPSASERTDHGLAVARPLSVPERPGGTLPDEGPSGGIRSCHL